MVARGEVGGRVGGQVREIKRKNVELGDYSQKLCNILYGDIS